MESSQGHPDCKLTQDRQAREKLGFNDFEAKFEQIEALHFDMNKTIFIQSDFNSTKIMSDILKVTMILDEEKLGCFIIAYYDTNINYNIILEAVHDNYYDLLHYIWAFGKNLYDSTDKTSVFISYNVLLDIIHIINEKDQEQEKEWIERVVNWLVVTDDNILISLLSHEYDDLALQYIGYYIDDINVDLLLYWLKFGNEKFLKGALKLSAFDKLIFRESKVMNQIISLLKGGLRIIYNTGGGYLKKLVKKWMASYFIKRISDILILKS